MTEKVDDKTEQYVWYLGGDAMAVIRFTGTKELTVKQISMLQRYVALLAEACEEDD